MTLNRFSKIKWTYLSIKILLRLKKKYEQKQPSKLNSDARYLALVYKVGGWHLAFVYKVAGFKILWLNQGSFQHVPNQWETTLHCNIISHWLGAYTKWSLLNYKMTSHHFTQRPKSPLTNKLEDDLSSFNWRPRSLTIFELPKTEEVSLSFCPLNGSG